MVRVREAPPRERIEKLIDEYLKRVYNSFIEGKSSIITNKIFKCPNCENNDFELKREGFKEEETLHCLWVECSFRLEVPSRKELEDFLKRKKEIHGLFQEV